ncbi:MAG TPA: HRDC domain-containing protein, partial [Gemmataceae bacterium]|nr:HRDC domain-containing protein [Gemmataceae bacterium]
RYLLPLWQRVSARLEELGRSSWATEEFERLAVTAQPEEVAPERWRKLRGLGSLDRRRLAVVRELYGWREETAARLNRPARTIVRDDLLLEIARRNPTRERDLHVVRGLAKRDLGEIVNVVVRARALPLDQCPAAVEREQDPPQVGLITNVLNAVLADWCSRNRLAPNLVASSNDVRLLVRARLQKQSLPEESLLTGGWRARHVLPELLAVLDGRRGLRIADLTAEAPFTFTDSVPSHDAEDDGAAG